MHQIIVYEADVRCDGCMTVSIPPHIWTLSHYTFAPCVAFAERVVFLLVDAGLNSLFVPAVVVRGLPGIHRVKRPGC